MLRVFRSPSQATLPARISADPLAALASAAQQGSADATRTLVVSVMPALLKAARGVLGTRHLEVEDVAQEAALGLLRALPDYRRDCSVLHFATRIAVLTALAARRRLRSRGAGLHQALDPQTPGAELSPAEALVAAHRRRVLRQLCDELPVQQTEALILHCVLGLSVEEVASTCGCPSNTAKSRLRLAKDALRTRIMNDPQLLEALGTTT